MHEAEQQKDLATHLDDLGYGPNPEPPTPAPDPDDVPDPEVPEEEEVPEGEPEPVGATGPLTPTGLAQEIDGLLAGARLYGATESSSGACGSASASASKPGRP